MHAIKIISLFGRTMPKNLKWEKLDFQSQISLEKSRFNCHFLYHYMSTVTT